MGNHCWMPIPRQQNKISVYMFICLLYCQNIICFICS
jgi:hypothetical protein